MSDVTEVLRRLENQPDAAGAEELLPLVYDELRRLAAHRLAQERADHTLTPTALVHEAWLKLAGSGDQSADQPREGLRDDEQRWKSRHHFFAAAAQAMRRILVDSARRRRAEKRGGEARRTSLEVDVPAPEGMPDLLALDEALERLEAHRPELVQLVNLRYFAGLTMPQAAEALGIPLRTAERNWSYAKAWLLREMGECEWK
jgi:RNA polymerase sigma factor (TIGR02999 family)